MGSIFDEPEGEGLNSAQRRHLLTTCQYADKLLSEIEAVLVASKSKSPFPKFRPDLSPAQVKMVEDYVARMRAQLTRILDGQGVRIPEAKIGSAHSIRVTLGFVDIAFDECRAKNMEGYGTVPPETVPELNGLVDEMNGLVARLDAYLAQGESADIGERLKRLEAGGSDIRVLKTIERIVARYGLVEFRPALATIIDRLEIDNFEIAVFGRVSSGKSSLLNHIAGQDVLPVGVNPITAVPTRLVYGDSPSGTVWFADRKPQQFAVERLAEFVTEQRNPGNMQHVTRIVVALPSSNLRQGIVYVDTPGLGSLATSGAAETKAYLPRCDLGVVLIDAGSTLTQDDLGTIQTLYDAGIPASVLLSKADLLEPADRERVARYIAEHISSDLGLQLPVHLVSVKTGYTDLLDKWVEEQILPLYDRHGELTRQSLSRKIGALRVGVQAAMRAHLRRAEHAEKDSNAYRQMETELRRASGEIAQARTECIEVTDLLHSRAAALISRAAQAVAQSPESAVSQTPLGSLLKTKLESLVADESRVIAEKIKSAADYAETVLVKAADSLGMENGPDQNELTAVLQDMPRVDLENLKLKITRSPLAALGSGWAARSFEKQARSQAGREIGDAILTHARIVQSWVRKTFTELQERFDSYADAYRAQLDRLTKTSSPAGETEEILKQDLADLEGIAGQITEGLSRRIETDGVPAYGRMVRG